MSREYFHVVDVRMAASREKARSTIADPQISAAILDHACVGKHLCMHEAVHALLYDRNDRRNVRLHNRP